MIRRPSGALGRTSGTAAARGRRAFLRAVGASACALPFFRSLELSAGEDVGQSPPLRLVTFYFPHGVSSPLFRRQPGDGEDDFDLDFVEPRSQARCVLRAFDDESTHGTSFKDRIVVVDGLDFVSGAVGHDGTRAVFTGGGTTSTGSSIEQYLAVEAGAGAETPFSSLVLGVGTNRTGDHQDNVSYHRGVALGKIIDPSETFDAVFAPVVTGADPSQVEIARDRRARGQSVVDFLRLDIRRLSARLGPRERAKLDQHLTSLVEIEKRLGAYEAGAHCAAPDAPTRFDSVRVMRDGEKNFDAITDLQLDLMAQALACDLTRFGSFWMADLSRGAVAGTGIDDPVYAPYNPDVHELVAHAYRPPRTGGGGEDEPGVVSSWAVSAVQHHYSYQKATRLLWRLEQSGLLDDTLVVIATDMGDTGLHSSKNVPFVLAGGAGGRLRTGRYLSLKPDGDREALVVPHNRLLVSIAQMFGAEVDAFGDTSDPEHARGALSPLA